MKVALQTYSIRSALAQNPWEAMEAATKTGYRCFELFSNHLPTAGNFGLPMEAGDAAALLRGLKAQIIGAHFSPTALDDPQWMGRFLDYQEEIGCRDLVLVTGFYRSAEDIRRWGQRLNEEAARLAARGFRLHYHHHYHEFQPFGDQTALELLMEETDPTLVFLELDTFWALRGGKDPLALIDRYRGRIRLLHQKDLARGYTRPTNLFDYKVSAGEVLDVERYLVGEQESCVEIGEGCMDIQGIINHGNQAGAEFLVLDQDFTRLGELRSIEVSMAAFRRYSGLEL
ncbi:MAG: sugar phosphate isomerase/epimerase [Oscillospiraceae bacterium]|nr:sugar phosphate isomerase/epimerase [Oscillospiraceae bacterium]